MNKSELLVNASYDFVPNNIRVALNITLARVYVYLRRYRPNTPICINIGYHKAFGADDEVKSMVNLGKFLLHIRSLHVLSNANVRWLDIECPNEDMLYNVRKKLEYYLLSLRYRDDPKTIVPTIKTILAVYEQD
jgi:hypothetical protein